MDNLQLKYDQLLAKYRKLKDQSLSKVDEELIYTDQKVNKLEENLETITYKYENKRLREKVAITEKAIEKCQNMIVQSQTMMEKIC